MKKIFLSLLFVAFSVSMNAQNVVDRETIKQSPNQLAEFVNGDITLLKNNYSNFTEAQGKALQELYYYKYKKLTADLSNEELTELTNSMKARTKVILGDDLYMKVSQNQPIFYRITGLAYLMK